MQIYRATFTAPSFDAAERIATATLNAIEDDNPLPGGFHAGYGESGGNRYWFNVRAASGLKNRVRELLRANGADNVRMG